MAAEVITEYPFPDVRDNYPSLKLIDRTGKGFKIVCDTAFVARHATDGRLRTCYYITLGDKNLTKYGSTFNICNTVELTIEGGYTSKTGEKGYLMTEKDDEDVNTYFVNGATLVVTTIKGEVVHFMMSGSSFANEQIAQNEQGKVETVSYTATRPVLHPGGCC